MFRGTSAFTSFISSPVPFFFFLPLSLISRMRQAMWPVGKLSAPQTGQLRQSGRGVLSVSPSTGCSDRWQTHLSNHSTAAAGCELQHRKTWHALSQIRDKILCCFLSFFFFFLLSFFFFFLRTVKSLRLFTHSLMCAGASEAVPTARATAAEPVWITHTAQLPIHTGRKSNAHHLSAKLPLLSQQSSHAQVNCPTHLSGTMRGLLHVFVPYKQKSSIPASPENFYWLRTLRGTKTVEMCSLKLVAGAGLSLLF